jgi:protein TonB
MNYAERSESGRRMSGLMIVLLLHVVVIYALVHGLARKIVDVVRNPLETKIVEEVKPPPDKPPPPPPPKLAQPPPPYIPPPEVNIQAPQSAPTITAVTPVKPPEPVPPPAAPPAPAPPAPAPPPRVPVRVGAVVDARQCEKPAYPPASLRGNETGTVLLNFLIDLNGQVLESKIERSSGHRRLDEAARAGLSLCKFKPATVDGKPEKTWSRIEYEWRIE